VLEAAGMGGVGRVGGVGRHGTRRRGREGGVVAGRRSRSSVAYWGGDVLLLGRVVGRSAW